MGSKAFEVELDSKDFSPSCRKCPCWKCPWYQWPQFSVVVSRCFKVGPTLLVSCHTFLFLGSICLSHTCRSLWKLWPHGFVQHLQVVGKPLWRCDCLTQLDSAWLVASSHFQPVGIQISRWNCGVSFFLTGIFKRKAGHDHFVVLLMVPWKPLNKPSLFLGTTITIWLVVWKIVYFPIYWE